MNYKVYVDYENIFDLEVSMCEGGLFYYVLILLNRYTQWKFADQIAYSIEIMQNNELLICGADLDEFVTYMEKSEYASMTVKRVSVDKDKKNVIIQL